MNTLITSSLMLLFIVNITQAAERPPQPPKKLPTFMEMIKQEEKKQSKQAQERQALIKVRQEQAATLQGLPADLQLKVISILFTSGTYKNIKELAQTIIALAETSKALRALMNDPDTILTIFSIMPYTANALTLAELLQAKPASLPVMKDTRIKEWISTQKSLLIDGWELFNEVSHNELKLVQHLLLDKHIDINWRNGSWTALVKSVELGRFEITRLLIAAGADPNIGAGKGPLALTLATYHWRNETTALLLAAGANPNLRYSDGATALMWAARVGNVDAIQMLIAGGADVNMKNHIDQTALFEAAARGYLKTVELLLAVGANPNIQDYSGNTVLRIAAGQAHKNIVVLLLKAGAKPNIQDESGWTALMIAALLGNSGIVQLLLAYGANPHLKTFKGETARDMAFTSRHYDVVEILDEAIKKRGE